jgi:hypothetical protein
MRFCVCLVALLLEILLDVSFQTGDDMALVKGGDNSCCGFWN